MTMLGLVCDLFRPTTNLRSFMQEKEDLGWKVPETEYDVGKFPSLLQEPAGQKKWNAPTAQKGRQGISSRTSILSGTWAQQPR